MSEFVAEELADLHNHLVPGVDDGARSPGESLHFLKQLRAEGVTRLAVSPHLDGRLVHEAGAVRVRLERLRRAYEELLAYVAGRDDVPALSFNQEVLVPDAETARRICREEGVGLEGTSFLLIEFGFELGPDPVEVVEAVVGSGRLPIVAHPERYRRLEDGHVRLDEIRRWKEAGAILQVNDGSVLGEYGEGIEALAWSLVSEGLVDLLSTDHHAAHRVVSPARVGWVVAERAGADVARRLLSENPRRILAGEPPLAL